MTKIYAIELGNMQDAEGIDHIKYVEVSSIIVEGISVDDTSEHSVYNAACEYVTSVYELNTDYAKVREYYLNSQ